MDLTLITTRTEERHRVSRNELPLGEEIRAMLADLAADFAKPFSSVYEIGCGCASVLPALHSRCPTDIRFICADDSPLRLARRREQLSRLGATREVSDVRVDFNQRVGVRNASVALMVLTLANARPIRRAALLADIHEGLNEGGCLLLVEPIRATSSLFNNLFARHLRERQPAIDHEPPGCAAADTRQEICDALAQAGFREIEIFFEWYGGCGIAALK